MTKRIDAFLRELAHQGTGMVRGSFEENQPRLMPQVIPPSLLDFCRRDGRELSAVQCVGNLSVTFVVDEPDRYVFLHRGTVKRWGVDESALLQVAMSNLRAWPSEEPIVKQFGTGDRLNLAWESFDGYDASRILLTQELVQKAALVSGNPVIAIPHRDYMVMFGDANEAFVAEMAERVRDSFEDHRYPITSRFFTLVDGHLALYQGYGAHERILN